MVDDRENNYEQTRLVAGLLSIVGEYHQVVRSHLQIVQEVGISDGAFLVVALVPRVVIVPLHSLH